MAESVGNVTIYTDGGSRGNPGPAAAGYVITGPGGKQLAAKGLYLGEATNNAAEYTAVIKALEHARELTAGSIMLYSDSELLVNQLNGNYKVKSEQLRPMFQKASELLAGFGHWSIEHITRDKNTKADELVNKALNLQQDVSVQKAKPKFNRKPVRLGVLISGGGRTLLNIVECINKSELNAEVAMVISSRSTVAGVERAKKAGLEVKVIRKKDYSDVDEFSKQIEKALVAADVELVLQGGWLCLWKIPASYENKVMNIHPALLPSFGGQGMWGHHVHEAVLAAGCRVSGCTVHFCTNEYDKGPIIVQRCCVVEQGDSADDLAARVFEQECIAYPEAISLFEQGRIKVEEGKVKILSERGGGS
ncbi:MAG: phosphoribosylglycinamide formyltransferase [Phycisphaerales bacterium]